MTTAQPSHGAPEPALNGVAWRFTPGGQRHDPDYRLVDASGFELGYGVQDCTSYRGYFIVYGFVAQRLAEICATRELGHAKAVAVALVERRHAVLQ